MKRKNFLKQIAGVLLLVGPAYALWNCSTSDDNGNNNQGNDPDCLANGANASNISANHGHSLTVNSSDVNAGVEKTYSIEGNADHVHEVTVTAANFASLQSNQQITVNSTTGNGHTHSVTISCA